MASIQKYGDRWRVQVFKNGHRKSAVWDTKRRAQDWAARTEAELSRLAPSADQPMTFGQAKTRYLETITGMKKPGARQWEERRLEVMQAFFGEDTPLLKITSPEIAKWRDHRLTTVSGSTVQREANLLRSLMLTARDEWKVISHHAFRGVRLPDEAPPRTLVWGWRDIRRVLRYCEGGGPKTQEIGRAFHLALRTAMRLKEVLQARMSGNVALLVDTKGTRVGHIVKVPLTRHGRRLLAKYPPFTINENEASAMFWQITIACGIRQPEQDGLTFHDSRATALTLMSRKMDVQTLQRISRHRDINILIRTYYRETPEQIAARL